MRVVICGAGIIGASVAYHLALRGIAPIIVEREAVACAASGKAGGFLALDWCDGSALGPLARASFPMHAALAEALGPGCGYRAVDTLALAAVAGDRTLSGGAPPPSWIDGACAIYRRLGDRGSTAQVHPARLTRALVDAARARGAELRIGTVLGVELGGGSSPRVVGVRVGHERVPADVVVVAMGPWSASLADSLPVPMLYAFKGQSIVLRPRAAVPAEALFVEYHDERGETHSPEIYPRPDGEIYVSGMASDSPLPEGPGEVAPEPADLDRLRRFAGEVSSALGDAEELVAQACYRPIARDGLPLLGALAGVEGGYVATGHSCWGILNAPASGLALAEQIVDGAARTVDLTPYDPGRPALSASS